jgi:hypothetical protein
MATTFTRKKLADIMEREAKKKLVWSPGSEAEKFKKKFWPVFGKGKWSWCAATVTWAAEEAGLPMPVKAPSKFGYTFALVEAWQQWAIEKGFYHDNDGVFKPERGDISCFDWTQSSIHDKDTDWENHIGVHLHMDGNNYVSAEGNTSNRTDIKTRTPKQIQGWIRIPDGFDFGAATPSPSNPAIPEAKPQYGLEAWKLFQKGCNAVGASLKVDGIPGPKTKAAAEKIADAI